MKNLNLKICMLLLFVAGILCIPSCEDKETDPSITLSVFPDNPIAFPAEGGKKTLTVTTNANRWKASSNQYWCRLEADGNKLIISSTENVLEESLPTAIVTITAGDATPITITVTQAGKIPEEPQGKFVYSLADNTIELAEAQVEAIRSAERDETSGFVKSFVVDNTQASDFKVGQQLIVGIVPDIMPVGLIGKISAINKGGSTTTIQCEPIPLQDAFDELLIEDTELDLSSYIEKILDEDGNEIPFEQFASGMEMSIPLRNSDYKPGKYTFSSPTVSRTFRQDEKLNIKVSAQGDFTMLATCVIKRRKLEVLMLQFVPKIDLSAEFNAELSHDFLKGERTLFTIMAAPIPMGPVVFTPIIKFNLSYAVQGKVGITSKVEFEHAVNFGFSYLNGKFHPAYNIGWPKTDDPFGLKGESKLQLEGSASLGIRLHTGFNVSLLVDVTTFADLSLKGYGNLNYDLGEVSSGEGLYNSLSDSKMGAMFEGKMGTNVYSFGGYVDETYESAAIEQDIWEAYFVPKLKGFKVTVDKEKPTFTVRAENNLIKEAELGVEIALKIRPDEVLARVPLGTFESPVEHDYTEFVKTLEGGLPAGRKLNANLTLHIEGVRIPTGICEEFEVEESESAGIRAILKEIYECLGGLEWQNNSWEPVEVDGEIQWNNKTELIDVEYFSELKRYEVSTLGAKVDRVTILVNNHRLPKGASWTLWPFGVTDKVVSLGIFNDDFMEFEGSDIFPNLEDLSIYSGHESLYLSKFIFSSQKLNKIYLRYKSYEKHMNNCVHIDLDRPEGSAPVKIDAEESMVNITLNKWTKLTDDSWVDNSNLNDVKFVDMAYPLSFPKGVVVNGNLKIEVSKDCDIIFDGNGMITNRFDFRTTVYGQIKNLNVSLSNISPSAVNVEDRINIGKLEVRNCFTEKEGSMSVGGSQRTVGEAFINSCPLLTNMNFDGCKLNKLEVKDCVLDGVDLRGNNLTEEMPDFMLNMFDRGKLHSHSCDYRYLYSREFSAEAMTWVYEMVKDRGKGFWFKGEPNAPVHGTMLLDYE